MFPGLALGDVHAALAYYFDNQSEIASDFEADDELSRHGSQLMPSRLRERLNG